MDPPTAPRNTPPTRCAGAALVGPDIARLVTAEARDHILNLTRMGTPFDRDAAGGYVLSREAAHSPARVGCVKGDQIGACIMRALVAAVRTVPSIQVLKAGWRPGCCGTGTVCRASGWRWLRVRLQSRSPRLRC